MSEATMAVMIDELKQKLKVLAEENKKLREDRDRAWARVMVSVPVATDEEERVFTEEIQSAGPGGQLDELIAELKATNG